MIAVHELTWLIFYAVLVVFFGAEGIFMYFDLSGGGYSTGSGGSSSGGGGGAAALRRLLSAAPAAAAAVVDPAVAAAIEEKVSSDLGVFLYVAMGVVLWFLVYLNYRLHSYLYTIVHQVDHVDACRMYTAHAILTAADTCSLHPPPPPSLSLSLY